MQNKTIKFFISSTFKDFIKERNALQNFVFPRLKKLCQKKGFSFQPVDLRWGITVESSEDNKTMEYCLNEVRRCSYDPKPNLLILFGQRYGWGPLPSDITIQEWDYIKSKVTKDELVKLENWYIQDLNDIDRKYFLKDKKGFERKEWEAIEKDLKNIIQNSTLDNKDEVGYSRFYKSATELEIIDALEKQYKSNSDNTIVYNRKFNDDINEDLIEGSEAKTKEEKAKAKEIQNKLKKLGNFINQKKITNMYNSSIDTYTYKNFNDEYHPINKESYAYPENMPEYLKDFCEEIYNKFETKIEKEIKSFNKNFSTLLEIELDEQERFLKSKYLLKEDQKNKRKQVIIDVIGRNNEVEEIKDFVIDTKSKEQYYLLYGKSGTGKTSVMAKALTKIKDKNNEYNIYYRFIGTTAKSSFSRQVFETLYWEIESQLKSDKKISQPHFEIDDIKFKKQFKELLQRLDDKKVVIFLDSIDQFEDDNDLSILLDDLPKNIKIVFSVLYDENKTDNNDYTKYYERLSNIKNFTKLDILDQSFNFQILKQLLEKDNRTLSTNEDNNQQNLVESFIKGQTPLCVKLTYEIVREWTSNKNIDGLKEELPSIDGENKEEELIIKFFNNVIKKHYVNGELLNLTLGLISASKDGLSETELIDIISNEEKILKSYDKDQRYQQLNKLPDAIFSKMYYHIQDIFTEKLIDGEMLINPYHRIIEEVIKDNFYKNNKNQLHKKLSDYFYLKQDKTKTWNKRYHNLHMLSEYPYQLFHSKQSKELKEILFDLEFAGSIYDNNKQASFRDIMSKATQLDNITEDEIYPWESFYREKEHLILKVDEKLWRPHQTLFQLAYEDGDDSSLTIEAKKLLEDCKINFNCLLLQNHRKLQRKQIEIIIDKYKEIKDLVLIEDKIYFKNNNEVYELELKNYNLLKSNYDFNYSNDLNILRNKYSNMNDDEFNDLIDIIEENDKEENDKEGKDRLEENDKEEKDRLIDNILSEYKKNCPYNFKSNASLEDYTLELKNDFVNGVAWILNENTTSIFYIKDNQVIKVKETNGNINKIIIINGLYFIVYDNITIIENENSNTLLNLGNFFGEIEGIYFSENTQNYIVWNSRLIVIFKINRNYSIKDEEVIYHIIDNELYIINNNKLYTSQNKFLFDIENINLENFINFDDRNYLGWNENKIFLINDINKEMVTVRGNYFDFPEYYNYKNNEYEKIHQICKISENWFSLITKENNINKLYILCFNTSENVFYSLLEEFNFEKSTLESNYKSKIINGMLYVYNTNLNENKNDIETLYIYSINQRIIKNNLFIEDLETEDILKKEEYHTSKFNKCHKIFSYNLFSLDFNTEKKVLNIFSYLSNFNYKLLLNYESIIFSSLDLILKDEKLYILYLNDIYIINNNGKVINYKILFNNEKFDKFILLKNDLFVRSRSFLHEVNLEKKNIFYFASEEILSTYDKNFISDSTNNRTNFYQIFNIYQTKCELVT